MSLRRIEVAEADSRETRPDGRIPKTGRGGIACLRYLDALEPATGVVLAVSGGPDSTALMHFAAAWRREGKRPPISVASVDHGLRTASSHEAEAVVDRARQLGFDAEILAWTGEKPIRGIQERARDARYALLADLAHRIGASHVVTAHTLDDQAETVLMRLARGSGIVGLQGMRPTMALHGLTLSRPFLAVPKSELVAMCRDSGWAFTEDPSNRNPAYARSRWRALAPALAREGLTAERLAKLALRIARADEAIEITAGFARQAATVGDPREARLFASSLAEQPSEIALRVIASVLMEAVPERRPRLERLEALTADMLDAARTGRPLRRTLNGCVVTLDAAGILKLALERPRRRGASLNAKA